jgi:[acyl-carrier-protein] S-malonyltransferase
MVAGHSLGEFSALVAAGALSFEEGLTLVAGRASAMQRACGINPSTMAAVLGMDDAVVEEVCSGLNGPWCRPITTVPGQIVISGTTEGVAACHGGTEEERSKTDRAAVRQRRIPFTMHGTCPARSWRRPYERHASTSPLCPVYQNVTGMPVTEPDR